MFKFIKYVFQYFKQRPHNLALHQQQPDDAFHSSSGAAPGYIPIETNIDYQPIPCTCTQSVGTEERLLQTPIGELITLNQRKGIRCGCDHVIYSIEPSGSLPGLGGQCRFCMLEAAQLLSQGIISLEQAEAMSLYCNRCAAAGCDGCGINVCRRHIHQFINLDASVTYLCDKCIKQAERDKFFRKTLTIMLSPFVNYNRQPSPGERREPYDY